MSAPTLMLLLLNFGFIGVLPAVFFKKGGRFNLRWWLTSAPLFVSMGLVLMDFSRLAPTLTKFPLAPGGPLELAAIGSAAASIALIAFALGSHRGPVSLWHQESNLPDGLVTWGAYRRIRHPFYAAFLLALLGGFLASPQPGTFFTLVYGLLALNYTAGREERQLLASPFGAEYEKYLQHTGRFWPRLWRKRA
jgi:protein-S-isoprenylcysteine O-methyltransferase Ste14